ncbi:MAG: SH3 domain-containing protein [Eubacteriales bacterium]|nr:SH3 domain-containing protein [Eubacteriales bacterium]
MLSSKRFKLVVVTMLLVGVFATSAMATRITATANVNVRKKATTSSTKLTVMTKGTIRTVRATSGNWYKVTVNGKTGYVNKSYATTTPTKITATSNVNVRQKATTSSTKLTVMTKGSVRTALYTSTNGKWYKVKVNGKTGYVHKNYVTTGNVATSTTNFYSNVCAMAISLLGKSYVYGATGPNSFDCSGYTQYIYKNCGKTIPRTSSSQYASCTKVSKSNLKAGYLVFFSSTAGGSSVGHVAIYIGDNKIAHAANSSSGVITSNLNSTYYASHYVGAGYY